VTPSTDSSESHKVAFEELMPLPKRERPVGKKARKKPPSYELTDTATIQFVSDSIQTNAKPRPKIKRKKEQSLLAVTPKKQKVKPKKQKVKANEKKKANGIYICAGCNVKYGDISAAYAAADWLACKDCAVWFHETCAEQNGLVDVNEFTCGKCFV